MQSISLNGKWKVQQKGKSKSISANVPGELFTDLLKAKQIADPFNREQELDAKWVWEADWSYSRKFKIDAPTLKKEKILLRCEGLDTLCTLTINGKKIASTDNMFRTWEFDIKKFLKAGENTIIADFDSAYNYCEKKDKQRKLPGWWGSMCATQFAWIRKSACNFGWDWGVKTPTCGIWRDMTILAYDKSRLGHTQILQKHTKNKVNLDVCVEVETPAKSNLSAEVSVNLNGKIITSTTVTVSSDKATASLEIKNPQLWWPINMGEQTLYSVSIKLLSEKTVIDQASKRIGMRTLVLDRHKDQWGESFQFKVNDVPFFAKGGNWIPVDALMGRRTEAIYKGLLKDCAEANINMLRVWGGGIYEDDVFYDTCDELGICVWQDFMFACSTYPVFQKGFVENCKAEAIDNVRRLGHHACIALWCGNNEIEQGLVKDNNENCMSWKEYSLLFDKTLGDVVKNEAPQTSFWPGSPHSPLGDRHDHRNPDCGDAHLWDVWHGKKPFEWYRTCTHRFNSEFGFQSFPQPSTVNGYTNAEDRNITSAVMEHHQRSGIGNTTIMTYMLDWYKLPTNFDMLLWTSQILQGMAMKYAVEHWRRSMPRGMGTLYWQINDNWPVASWSSIDYHGNWKALQYMAKKFFAPVLLSGLEDMEKGTIEVNLTCDHVKPVSGNYSWKAVTMDGKVVAKGGKSVKSAGNGNKLIDKINLAKTIDKVGIRNLIVVLKLNLADGTTAENLVHFCRPKHLELSGNPGINCKISKISDTSFRVKIKTQKPALWAWLQITGISARFSDNFLHLIPGEEYTIEIDTAKKIDVASLKEKLIVNSLTDTFK